MPERYAIFSILLYRYKSETNNVYINVVDYEKECQMLSQRLCILNGTKDLEYFDHKLFRGYLELIKDSGYVHLKDDKIQISDSLEDVAKRSMKLLSNDVLQSIKRVNISI